MTDPLIIKRDELAKVFKNADTLRKIEALFKLAAQTTPAAVEAILGAAQPVRIPENFSNADWIRLAENPKVADYARTVRWNQAEKSLEYVTAFGNSIQVGKKLWDNSVNKTGGIAAVGKVVYNLNLLANRFTYDFADATDGAKCSLVGVVSKSTADNAEGPVVFFGDVIDVDTSAYAVNDKLYVAADGTGTLTKTIPVSPNFRIWVATVKTSHATDGIIFVDPRLYYSGGVTFEDLHVRETFTSGDFTGGDYLELEDTGFEETHGDARDWDDVYPSGASIGKGASAPNTTAYHSGTNFDLLAPVFLSAAPTKEMTLHFQIYHSYDEGTDIIPHLHLYVPDNVAGGNIVFDFEYHWSNVSATGAISTTTGSATLVRAAAAGIAQNILLELVDPASGVGKLISSIFSITISRDTADSFGGSVWLTSADCHIRKNTKGSRLELTK